MHGTGDDSLRAAEVERLPDDQESNGRLTRRDDQPTDLIELKPTGDTPYLTLAEAAADGKGDDELEPIRERKRILSYAFEEPEAFARAYAQWIAVRSGSAAMRDELDLILSGRAGTPWRYWGHDDFLPVAAAFDRLFMSWGWTVTTPGVP